MYCRPAVEKNSDAVVAQQLRSDPNAIGLVAFEFIEGARDLDWDCGRQLLQSPASLALAPGRQ